MHEDLIFHTGVRLKGRSFFPLIDKVSGPRFSVFFRTVDRHHPFSLPLTEWDVYFVLTFVLFAEGRRGGRGPEDFTSTITTSTTCS